MQCIKRSLDVRIFSLCDAKALSRRQAPSSAFKRIQEQLRSPWVLSCSAASEGCRGGRIAWLLIRAFSLITPFIDVPTYFY